MFFRNLGPLRHKTVESPSNVALIAPETVIFHTAEFASGFWPRRT